MVISTKTFRPAFLFITIVILGAQFAQAQRVGINTPTPSFTLDIRGLNPDDGGLLQIANSDETQRLLLFSGREGDPNPFMQWKAGSPMRFVTDEGGFKELMRIASDGNVGIGLQNPASLLHIKGDDDILILDEKSANNIGTGAILQFRGQTSGNIIKNARIGIVPEHTTFSHRNGALEVRIPDRFNIYKSNLTFSNDIGFTLIGASGHIGIGNSSPNAALQFGNVINNRRLVLWEAANNDHQFFGFGMNDNTLRYQVPGIADRHIFYGGTGTSTSSELMRIQGNGNVGIGIPAPTEKLHVAGNIRVQNDASIFGLDQLVGFNDLRLAGDAVGGTDLYISPSGNVGIGMTSPTEKLHIAGNIRVQNDASIFGLDQLVGFNDLKFSGDNEGGPDMRIRTDGRIGINNVGSLNSLFIIRSKPDDLYTMYVEDNNAVFRFGVQRTGQVGINVAYPNVTLGVRGITGDAEYFRVENPTGGTILRALSNGNVAVTNNLSKGGGSFKIDHPLDPENKYLYHSFVESPDMMNVYNGNITTNSNGEAMVTMPDWFEALNKDFRYQLTTIGQPAQAWVQDELKGNRFTLKTDKPNIKVSWQITGIRKDAWAEKNRIPVEEKKNTEERGKYQHPESFGKPATLGVGFKESMDGNILRNE